MSGAVTAHAARPTVAVALVVASLGVLALSIASGTSTRLAAIVVIVTTFAALLSRSPYVPWRQLIAGLILIILFIPIRRYSLPGNLPLHLEPYRIYVALLLLGGGTSLLVDHRVRLRRTGLEGPLALILVAACTSIVANPGRVADVSSDVNKKLMFFVSFVLVLYLTASVVRRLDDIDYLTKTLVSGGAVVAFFAVIEARTGFNVFNHLSRIFPFLHGGEIGGPEFLRVGTARLRVFASAEHPIALSAALVMLAPLALYLARRYDQRRWLACALILCLGFASTVSRTGIVMFVVMVAVFLWLRPRETRRLWPAILPALILIHFALPGTLGAIKHSFTPPGGLVNQQRSDAGQSGSGRLADVGPALQEWKRRPLFGEGFGTRVVDPSAPGSGANILDDQWLGTLLETGALGLIGWAWFFIRIVRRLGAEAKQDDSERGWLLASFAAAIAAYAVGMLTYDAFSFIQVTFLLFIFVGLGSALLAERPVPVAVKAQRDERGRLADLSPSASTT